MHILFCCKNQENVLQREIKAYLLTADTSSSWSSLIESLKITCARSYAWFLNFYWIVFRKISYPNLSYCDLSKVPKRKQIESILTCPKLAKWISTLNCSKSAKWPIWNLYISSHLEARNNKFGQQVNIERVPLGTPPQAVVMSLAHNHMTNLFISSYRGATVIKFGQ